MRRVHAFLCATAWLVFAYVPAFGSDVASRVHALTLLLQVEQPASDRVLSEVKRELDAVLKDTGIVSDLRLFDQMTPYQEFGDLVVVRLRGECKLDARPVRRPDGPLAFAHTSDGQVLPFMEVMCDRIKGTIRPIMWGDQFRRADELLGRAMARVMAHELYHILGQTCEHGDSGIAKHSLTGRQLIADTLNFESKEVQRIQSVTQSGM
jgi:hypothetical protein